MRKLVTLLSLLLSVHFLSAQVNGFANVFSVTGSTLVVNNVDETYDTFEIGENVVIMQMQDDVIGANTGNNANFGDLSNISSAGLYEVRQIIDITEWLGRPIEIELAPLSNTYNCSINGSVQLITFPDLGGGGGFTTTADISTIPWNGYVGGVIAFEVQGKLTIDHDIFVDEAGFRGGLGDQFNSGSCDISTYRFSNTAPGTDQYATKGEGIYRVTNPDHRDAKGKILNGGGGGNEHNGGGGGGGNYTSGGTGGPGWSCGGNSAGGIGGIGLNANISANRIFMGGGGGGGEGNNSQATNGANGGGIILIKADNIDTPNAGHRISANGEDVSKAGQDGAGGAGAGGTVVINCQTFTSSFSNNLSIEANGGDGGFVDHYDTHGGGGGGGQGAIIFSAEIPTSANISTNNGVGGCNNDSDPCNSQAGSGVGTNGSGIIGSSSGPLPIELLSFQAIPVPNKVQITWSTAMEVNNDYFTIERSSNGETWETIGIVDGAGDSHTTLNYNLVDQEPIGGISFYRLMQTDHDGSFTYSDIRSVQYSNSQVMVSLYPNPTKGMVNITCNQDLETGKVRLYDNTGRQKNIDVMVSGNSAVLNTIDLESGSYYLIVETRNEVVKRKLIVQ